MNIYEKEIQRLRDRRRTALDDAQIKWQNALRASDALYDAFVKYQDEMINAARGQKNSLDKARAELNKIKAKLGLTDDILDPPYSCPDCRDTGRVNGKYCRCVIKNAIAADRANLELPAVDFNAAMASAPSAAVKKAYERAEKYVSDKSSKSFLVLVGEPGTGKTMLASAIACAAAGRGASVVTVTAFSFVRRALDYHTQFSVPDYIDRFTPMLDCELLVIDDLGTENTLKNVTKEYLYTVINERWSGGKRTVITTNLKPADINERYGESIFSRMFDKNRSTSLLIDTKNARIS